VVISFSLGLVRMGRGAEHDAWVPESFRVVLLLTEYPHVSMTGGAHEMVRPVLHDDNQCQLDDEQPARASEKHYFRI
jgi:hypothetical protein